MMTLEHIFDEVGFTAKRSKTGHVTAYAFTRTTAGRKEQIYLTHRGNKFEMPWVRVAFPQVEQVIGEAAGISPDDMGTIHRHAFPELAPPALTMDKRMINVSTEAEEKIFGAYLMEFYKKGAKRFFESYTTLEALDAEISALPDEQMQSFITDSGGNTALHRALVIKALAHNPGTTEYYLAWKKMLLPDIGDATVKKMYDLLINIAGKLQIKE
jgi:hypothetical protein